MFPPLSYADSGCLHSHFFYYNIKARKSQFLFMKC
ncbi:hypothetical protein CLOBOL_05897 [Enterocloster bolteae ATCC BAA-613]|uniref:Uncharacterized protein n=1 Tax=Enterocloster bolteae (strain ATCC BAA-613 / DSM 15670 / CCUG 46953 / JCM 12243 / WAL 16351) TaxID=411902 RepID=A8S197_ENTBW|nr:hypothetical protein CLOBOL_05897 [Enterocloster bolteae ATCC BAA-613]